jgi:hypothetical protein
MWRSRHHRIMLHTLGFLVETLICSLGLVPCIIQKRLNQYLSIENYIDNTYYLIHLYIESHIFIYIIQLISWYINT